MTQRLLLGHCYMLTDKLICDTELAYYLLSMVNKMYALTAWF